MVDQKPRLLIIDDDAQICRTYDRILRGEIVVETAADAESAMRRLAVGPAFDVVLCDCNLAGGLSGAELAASFRPELRARTIMCSGSEPPVLGFDLGERFFHKGRPIPVLIALLRRVIGASRKAA